MPLQFFSSPLSIPCSPCLHTTAIRTRLFLLPKRVNTQLGCSSQPDPSLPSSDPVELLEKPNPIPLPEDETKPETRQSKADLTTFLNLFSNGLSNEESPYNEQASDERPQDVETNSGNLYYDPKAGDFVMGVVVSGDENKVEVDIGADKLAIMLKKEAMPLYDEEMEHLACNLDGDGMKGYFGKMGIVRDEVGMGGGAGKSVVEIGTVVYAEVLGRTLGARPLVSCRRLFRRLALHRVRQMMHQDEPIEVKLYEWNTGGLLTRIEGLRAFLPKAEMMTKINNFTDYNSNVGRCIKVCIEKMDEANNLIISEKVAWEKIYLKEGTLLQGSVFKMFPFGVQIKIGQTNRTGLLHISNISKGRIRSINEVLKIGEEVKVLVVKSIIPDRIALSISELESEPGLFLSNKEKVFSEAEEMAKEYRKKLPIILPKQEPPPTSDLAFDDETKLYANWNWLRFERPVENENNQNDDSC
ncbi:nucleic acid-binding proteins superfamily [Carex rostrata]